eukprot:gene40-4291_t
MAKIHPLKYILLVIRYIVDFFRVFLLLGNVSTSVVMIVFSDKVIKEYSQFNGIITDATKQAFKDAYLASSLVNGIVIAIYYAISFTIVLYLLGSTMVGDTALNITLSLALPGPLFAAAVAIGFPALQFVIYLFIANSDTNYYLVAIASIIAAAFHFIFLILAVIAEVGTFILQLVLRLKHPDPDRIDKDGITTIKDVRKIFDTYVDFVFKGKVKTESQVVN